MHQDENEKKAVAAECKVVRQSNIVSAMHHDDPALPYAQKLLKQMILSSTSAQLARAMLEYATQDTTNVQTPADEY